MSTTNPNPNLNPPSSIPHSAFDIPHSPPTPFPLYPGNLNLIIGRPGVGKSLLALDLAARAVHGTLPRPYLPKQKPPAQDALPKAYRPGTAAILSVEHHNLKLHLLSFGLEPRFADMPPRDDLCMDPYHNDTYTKRARRYYNDSPFIAWLRQDDHADLRVLVLDPLPAFLGPINATTVALLDQLQPILDYAVEKQLFIIGVTHIVKSPRRRDLAFDTIGSLGYSAMARSILLLTHDQHPPEGADPINRRLLVPVKNNHAAIDAAYAFTFRPRPPMAPPVEPQLPNLDRCLEEEKREMDAEFQSARTHYYTKKKLYEDHLNLGEPLPPVLDWDEKPLLHHPQLPILHPSQGPHETREESEFQQTLFLRAMEFLRDLLKDGPMPTGLVYSLGAEQGLSKRTIERARSELEIHWFIQPAENPQDRYVMALPHVTSAKVRQRPPRSAKVRQRCARARNNFGGPSPT